MKLPRLSHQKINFFKGIVPFLILFSLPTVSIADIMRIGLLLPSHTTGQGRERAYLRGAEIAAAELNASEGRQGSQIHLFIQRGSYLEKRDLTSLRKRLLEERFHFLMGSLPREEILSVARMVQGNKTPFLVFPADFMASLSTGEEPTNLIWISPAPEAFQRAAVRILAQFPQRRIYLMGRDSKSGRAWGKYFWEEMARLKPDALRAGESFLPAQIDDYTPYIQKALSADSEVCLSHLGVDEWLKFFHTARKDGYFKKVIHFELESGNLESLSALPRRVPEGIWGISAFPFWALDGKEAKEFVAKYKKNVNSYPSLAALSGYISIYALFDSARKSGTLESGKVIGTMEELTLRTPVGLMRIRNTDHRTIWPIWVGSAQWASDYPFPILGDLKSLGPESFSQ